MKLQTPPKIDYDQETGIVLVTYSDRAIKDSEGYKNCIFDFDRDGNICQVEILPHDLQPA